MFGASATLSQKFLNVLISKQGSLCAGPHNLVYETSPHPHWYLMKLGWAR